MTSLLVEPVLIFCGLAVICFAAGLFSGRTFFSDKDWKLNTVVIWSGLTALIFPPAGAFFAGATFSFSGGFQPDKRRPLRRIAFVCLILSLINGSAGVIVFTLNTAAAEYYKGAELIKKAKYAEALPHFNLAIERDSTLASSFAARGICRLKSGDLLGAYEDLNQAIAINPQLAVAYEALAMQYLEDRQFARAAENARQAVGLNPKSVDSYLTLASSEFERNNYKAAIEAADSAIALDPTMWYCDILRGICYDKLGNHEAAVEQYTKATSYLPKDASEYNGRATAYNMLGKYDEAIADTLKAVALKPNWADPLVTRAQSHFMLGENDKALNDANAAIKLNSGSEGAYEARACLYLKDGRYQKAADDLERIIKMDGWRTDSSLYNAIRLYACLKRIKVDKAAEALVKQSTKMGNQSLWPYPILRYLKGEIGEERLLAMAGDPNKKTECRAYLGIILASQGLSSQARPHLEWAVKSGNKEFVEHALALSELSRL